MYCEIKQNTKRRTCKLTKDASKDSSECKYDEEKKKCFVKSQKSDDKGKKPMSPKEKTTKSQSSKNSKKNSSKSPNKNTHVKEFLFWCENIDKDIKSQTQYTILRKEPTINESKIDVSTLKDIKYKDVPYDAISILTYDTYKTDDDFKDSKFCKISTCKNCSNNGIFDVNEIKELAKNNFLKCMICQEPFKMQQVKMEPPFGSMTISIQGNWYVITFMLKSIEYSRIERAFYPICPEGKLALWLLIKAWKEGKLFRVAISVTTGKRGIVFSGIHLRTRNKGGIENHGYTSNPLQDIKKIIINMISECNANDIFTPEQMDAFAL